MGRAAGLVRVKFGRVELGRVESQREFESRLAVKVMNFPDLFPRRERRTSSRGAYWGPRGTAAATIASRLTFDRVARRYGESFAVRDLSLDIAPGEVVCLLGPSGCGKTTLLRLAAGIEKVSGGRILMDGQEVSGPNRFVPPEKRGIGLMFQDFALFPHLSILENVAFGLRSLSRAEAHRIALAALERVGLARYADDYPHVLSGGEQQRAALARAMAPRPSVLLMDEPFSGLDIQLRDSMQEETLAILKETRATCMIVTHHSEEAMRMGDRIAVMRAGRLVQQGDAEHLYREPADLFVARLFSDINELRCRVEGGKLCTPLGGFPADGLQAGEEAVLCIRQRGVRLVAPGAGRAGRVLNVRFLGDAALVEIAVEGLDQPLRARLSEREAPSPHAEVGVDIAPESVLVFAPEENRSD